MRIGKIHKPRNKRKVTTAYIVKMTFFWVTWIVLGIAAIMNLMHIFKIHI